LALHTSGELRAYATIPPTGPVGRPTARRLIHGYYACVSFIDAQIGRIMESLDQLGLADNTVVVLFGDHGWQLGEHGMWNKHSCFETSMHAPLIFVAPSTEQVRPGIRVSALTEFIDIYPTLCELTGVPLPEHLEGRSALPLMKNPAAPWKPYAVGRFRQGDTIRSDRYRFSEYTNNSGEVQARMLYDHRSDPAENSNIAEQPGQA
ncbi:MAG: sulfatase-like hydrolase/transferase, partial [bacterium]|nr:sulfatase-like hydrolase/transferase [bacterium]